MHMKIGNYEKFDAEVNDIIDAYDYLVKGIDKKAKKNKTGRAYGGIVRSGKGKMVESITEQICLIAWESLGGDTKRISFEKCVIRVPIKKNYIDRLKNVQLKNRILKDMDKYVYPLRTDVCINIDSKFSIGVECKAYTENAMLKRILVDFTLRKLLYPRLDCVLLQLESQLTGDYSEIRDITLGSYSTHTLLSYFDIDLNIITLLKGERKVDEPIHAELYYKALTKENICLAANVFKGLLKKYL